MTISELRDMGVNELTTRKRELNDELFHLRIQQAGGQLERPSQLRSLRKEVARIETILTDRRNTAAAK
jgi:large subunit ribosomal protein L29